MSTEKIDHRNYNLDPKKKVEIDKEVYDALVDFVGGVITEHTTVNVEDRYNYFHKETGEPLKKKNLKQEQIDANYVKRIDLGKTLEAFQKAIPKRDRLGLFGLELQTRLYGVRIENIENGNRVERSAKPLPESDLRVVTDEEE